MKVHIIKYLKIIRKYIHINFNAKSDLLRNQTYYTQIKFSFKLLNQ